MCILCHGEYLKAGSPMTARSHEHKYQYIPSLVADQNDWWLMASGYLEHAYLFPDTYVELCGPFSQCPVGYALCRMPGKI